MRAPSTPPERSRGALVRAALIAGLACLGIASVVAAQAVSPTPSPAPTNPAEPSASPSATASPFPSASPGASALVATVEVQAFDLGFTPSRIELAATGTSRIVLTNTGGVVHNLTVDALGVQAVAARGGASEAYVTDPPRGTYEFYCSVSGHRLGGMVGTLVVR